MHSLRGEHSPEQTQHFKFKGLWTHLLHQTNLSPGKGAALRAEDTVGRRVKGADLHNAPHTGTKEPTESSASAVEPADPWSICTMAWTPLLPLLTRYPGSWRFQRLVFGVIPLLLFLIPKMGLFLVSGASSQPLVTQEPSLWTVTLTRASSTGVVPGGHYPFWFQQKPGQVPRTLI